MARNVAALGAACTIIGVTGADETGRLLKTNLIETEGITSRLVVDPTRQTTSKTRFVAQGQHLLRVDCETTDAVSMAIEDKLIETAKMDMATCQVIILSDYAKGVLTRRVISEVIKAAKDAAIPVVVDPKSTDFTRYAGATIVTPNLKEASEAVQQPLQSDADVSHAARYLSETGGIPAVLITRSKDGMTLFDDSKEVYHIPAVVREVADVVGAGDTVISVLALGLATGLYMYTAARISNLAAGVVVSKRGTATVSLPELLEQIAKTESTSTDAAPLLMQGIAEAGALASTYRAQGLTVGFTNGVFDLVHPGHLAVLRYAKNGVGRLIVGINSDASVRRLGKSPERPINDARDRVEVLGSFSMVDAVVVFEEDTPYKMIEAIMPDVLTKGADYTMDAVVGADIVKARGGEVWLAPLVPGKSSTSMIQRATSPGKETQ